MVEVFQYKQGRYIDYNGLEIVVSYQAEGEYDPFTQELEVTSIYIDNAYWFDDENTIHYIDDDSGVADALESVILEDGVTVPGGICGDFIHPYWEVKYEDR